MKKYKLMTADFGQIDDEIDHNYSSSSELVLFSMAKGGTTGRLAASSKLFCVIEISKRVLQLYPKPSHALL